VESIQEENYIVKILSKASTASIIALLALIAFKLYATKAAPRPAQLWSASCVATIPKSWGQFKGGNSQTGIAFEDTAGTLRFVTNIRSWLSKFGARTTGSSTNTRQIAVVPH
jgi:hypothetical protein